MTEHRWRDIHGDSGRLSSDPDDLIISIELHEGKEGYAAHDIPIAEARALHDALGKALAEVDPKPSQPEPHPTGNGGLVTPPLLQRLSAHPGLTALVLERDAFGRSKYGTGLCTNNGRNPLEDGRQEIGDLLQYLQQATMEGKDIGPLLKLCRDGLDVFEKVARLSFDAQQQARRLDLNLMEYVEKVRDVTTGSNPASRARAEELYADITQDMRQGDPRKGMVDRLHEMLKPAPTLHPRPFFWDSNERFGFVNVADDDVPEPERMTLEWLLELVPNALDGKESHQPLDPCDHPGFGFQPWNTGPRTLREYLEAP